MNFHPPTPVVISPAHPRAGQDQLFSRGRALFPTCGAASRPAGLFSFGLLDGPQRSGYEETAGSPKTRPAHHLAGVHKRDAHYASRRGPRRRAQTWQKNRPAHHLAGVRKRGARYSASRGPLFSAPCALREAHGNVHVLACRDWAGEINGFGLSRLATAFMNNPG